MQEKIKELIEEYSNIIDDLEEDRKHEGLTISNAYRTAKIGVFGKVIADLTALLEGGE